jgi:hypothetical protein
LGIYIFLRRAAPPVTEGMARETAPFIKLKRRLPLNRYTGKFSTPRANMVEKTTDIMTMVNRGLRILHK